MKANELRIGNHIEYFMEDSQDERKIWWELDVVDAQTILQLETYPDDPDYRPIILTEEWLIKFGFEKRLDGLCTRWHIGKNPVTHDWLFYINWLNGYEHPFYQNGFHEVKYVNKLQNLYFALTGEELNYKD